MTAYEMRISDWSSDVCSSDLPVGQLADDLVALGTRRRQFAVVVIKRQRRQRRQRLGAAVEEQFGEFVTHLLGQQRHFRRLREILDQLAEDGDAATQVADRELQLAEPAQQVEFIRTAAPGEAQLVELLEDRKSTRLN